MKFKLEDFHRDVPESELLADLRAVNDQLAANGETMTFRSYNKNGRFAASTISLRFGSWNVALLKAGIRVTQEKSVPVESLFDNLKIVWIANGRQPVFRDMNCPPSIHTASIYANRFGSWRNALKEFVASVDQEGDELIGRGCAIKAAIPLKRPGRNPSLSLRFTVLRRDGFRCLACGRSPATEPGLILEVDHHLPWSQGGETHLENLRTLCFDCNRGKGAT